MTDDITVLHSVPAPDPDEWDADDLHARLDGNLQQLRVLAERVATLAAVPPPRDLIDETLLVVLSADLLATLRVERHLRNLLRLAVAG